MPRPFRRNVKNSFVGYYLWLTDSTKSPKRKLVSLRTKDDATAQKRSGMLLEAVGDGSYDPWGAGTSVLPWDDRFLGKDVTLGQAIQHVFEERWGRGGAFDQKTQE